MIIEVVISFRICLYKPMNNLPHQIKNCFTLKTFFSMEQNAIRLADYRPNDPGVVVQTYRV